MFCSGGSFPKKFEPGGARAVAAARGVWDSVWDVNESIISGGAITAQLISTPPPAVIESGGRNPTAPRDVFE
jgi:hypothetical protein